MIDYGNQKTPTGRPYQYPRRIRAFINQCIDDGTVDGLKQSEMATLASAHLDYEVTEKSLHGQMRSMGISWKEVTTRAHIKRIKAILIRYGYDQTVESVQAELLGEGIDMPFRTCARRVADLREENQRDKQGGR